MFICFLKISLVKYCIMFVSDLVIAQDNYITSLVPAFRCRWFKITVYTDNIIPECCMFRCHWAFLFFFSGSLFSTYYVFPSFCAVSLAGSSFIVRCSVSSTIVPNQTLPKHMPFLICVALKHMPFLSR